MNKFMALVVLVALCGCQKTITSTSKKSSDVTENGLPGGGSGGYIYSGVSAETGYEQLSKHMVPHPYPAGPTWDGTYDFSWYNLTFNVSVAAYPLTGGPGTPIGMSFNVSSPAYQAGGSPPTAIPGTGMGPGMAGFTEAYVVAIPTGTTLTAFGPSSGGITIYRSLYNNFINALNNPPTPLPAYPAVPGADIVKTTYGSSSVITVTGKFIRIAPGTYDVAGIPYAVAELAWKPSSNNYACNPQCQYCATHPNDPTCP